MMIKAPFLRNLHLREDKYDKDEFPFNTLPCLKPDFNLDFTTPITFLIGENGSGKSTLIEAIAALSGFHESGGGRELQLYQSTDFSRSVLAPALRAVWSKKVTHGYFFRAESFFNLANYIDETAWVHAYYGGRKMHQQSHGESFLALFSNRLTSDSQSIYIMDEPEAALSPARQLSLLSILHDWEKSENVQTIIATHSPILLSYPNARILTFDDQEIREIEYEATAPCRITKSFLNNPDVYLSELLKD